MCGFLARPKQIFVGKCLGLYYSGKLAAQVSVQIQNLRISQHATTHQSYLTMPKVRCQNVKSVRSRFIFYKWKLIKSYHLPATSWNEATYSICEEIFANFSSVSEYNASAFRDIVISELSKLNFSILGISWYRRYFLPKANVFHISDFSIFKALDFFKEGLVRAEPW